eukprot:c20628_g1_i1.p2 GENE.c20628_g1_i1~~c20628_g1_i1.p2  ORF type:complete len:140 (+),score=13.05 c20628_g1_i1:1475-1894(+)
MLIGMLANKSYRPTVLQTTFDLKDLYLGPTVQVQRTSLKFIGFYLGSKHRHSLTLGHAQQKFALRDSLDTSSCSAVSESDSERERTSASANDGHQIASAGCSTQDQRWMLLKYVLPALGDPLHFAPLPPNRARSWQPRF